MWTAVLPWHWPVTTVVWIIVSQRLGRFFWGGEGVISHHVSGEFTNNVYWFGSRRSVTFKNLLPQKKVGKHWFRWPGDVEIMVSLGGVDRDQGKPSRTVTDFFSKKKIPYALFFFSAMLNAITSPIDHRICWLMIFWSSFFTKGQRTLVLSREMIIY